MDHEERLAKFNTKREDLAPEDRQRVEHARAHFKKLREEGKYMTEWEAERHLRPPQVARSEQDAQPVVGPVVSTVSVPADAVLAYGIGRQTLGQRDPESGEWITTTDENQGHA